MRQKARETNIVPLIGGIRTYVKLWPQCPRWDSDGAALAQGLWSRRLGGSTPYPTSLTIHTSCPVRISRMVKCSTSTEYPSSNSASKPTQLLISLSQHKIVLQVAMHLALSHCRVPKCHSKQQQNLGNSGVNIWSSMGLP